MNKNDEHPICAQQMNSEHNWVNIPYVLSCFIMFKSFLRYVDHFLFMHNHYSQQKSMIPNLGTGSSAAVGPPSWHRGSSVTIHHSKLFKNETPIPGRWLRMAVLHFQRMQKRYREASAQQLTAPSRPRATGSPGAVAIRWRKRRHRPLPVGRLRAMAWQLSWLTKLGW